jgi:hypothetical protein
MIAALLVALAAQVPPAAGPAVHGSPAPRRVLVYTLTSTPSSAPLARRLSEELLVHLAGVEGVTAIGEAELELLLEHERDKHSVAACDEGEACMARLFALAQADVVVTGRLGRWGRTGWLVTLKLTHAETATLERGESATAADEATLVQEARSALSRLLGVGAAPAPERRLARAAGRKIAVLDLAAYDVSSELSKNLTELLALELRRFSDATVVSPSDIRTLLEYAYDRQVLSGEDDVARLVEIGGALGVDHLIGGGVGRLDDTYVIHLKLLDVARGAVDHRVSESFRGPTTALPSALRFAVASLLGISRDGRGAVRMSSNAEPAQANVDAGDPLALPLPAPLTLTVGKHAVTVRAEDHRSASEEFYVEPDTLTELRVELEPIPAEWYERWWVWTLIGVAAAGATTAGVLLTGAPTGAGGVVAVGAPGG